MKFPEGTSTSLVEQLGEKGVTQRAATRLVEIYGADAVRAQLDYAPYRKPGTNPAGALVRAIEDGWAPPEGWAQARERAAEAARRAEEEERTRAEEEERTRAWAALSPEERVRGRLEFWIAGRRRRLGREPAPQEIADQQRALIAQLATHAGGIVTQETQLTQEPPQPPQPHARQTLVGGQTEPATVGAGRRAPGPMPLSAALPAALRNLVPRIGQPEADGGNSGAAAPGVASGPVETRRTAAR